MIVDNVIIIIFLYLKIFEIFVQLLPEERLFNSYTKLFTSKYYLIFEWHITRSGNIVEYV